MKKLSVISAFLIAALGFSFGLQQKEEYRDLYSASINDFSHQLTFLQNEIATADLSSAAARESIKIRIHDCRLKMKALDFWLRYFEPIAYLKVNGPLPVEWENEVFEKYEAPYRRDGAGLTLAEQYLQESNPERDTLHSLIGSALTALNTFKADSITQNLKSYHHFFLANRLFLLNLAAIYTTGFECPDSSRIVPELQVMMAAVGDIYRAFNEAYPSTALSNEYLLLYSRANAFVAKQPESFSAFDHFSFIRDYVNPLFALNQGFINQFSVVTSSYNDYTLNNDCRSIFDKSLYASQNVKGVFSLVEDEAVLKQIKQVGKLLFYDPILSANNSRSCASCHKPTEYFTDTAQATAFRFDRNARLMRNTPSLINVVFNHLVMLDGKLIGLQPQLKDVIENKLELNSQVDVVLKKVLSCKEYKDAFKKFLKFTPEEKEIGLEQIASAITFYYADFSKYYSPFDEAMTNRNALDPQAIAGFNLFMGKAQCGTCHFVPAFNGVKPPYVSSEFEVLGVPSDTSFRQLSPDRGRYLVNPAKETMNAFRTSTVRNTAYTKPYMHNGVFQSLEQVIDFYDAGGGAGRKLPVNNQTLSSDSLKLSGTEKKELIAFIHSLNERVIFEAPPTALPSSSDKQLNGRKIGGEY
jgi:cytochrome c peroxidase